MMATAIRASFLVLATAGLGVALVAPARAETLAFKADLKPVAGTNSKATGSLTAEFDTDSKKLTWRGTYRGLGTYATAANMHGPGAGPRGVVVRLRTIDSPFEGTAIVAQKQAEDLIAGHWYLLVRTAAYPNGELRGDLVRN
jgi:CHRD domain